jgi:hypothetical protein
MKKIIVDFDLYIYRGKSGLLQTFSYRPHHATSPPSPRQLQVFFFFLFFLFCILKDKKVKYEWSTRACVRFAIAQ